MGKFSFPEGRGPRIMAGSVIAVVAVTFGVAVGGLFKADLAAGNNAKPAAVSDSPLAKAGGVPSGKPDALLEKGMSIPHGFELLSVTGEEAKTADTSRPTFFVKRILNVDKPLDHGDYIWDDAGVPDGPVVVTVDLKAQTLSVFRDGYEIGVAVILYGADDKPSPVGVYPIMQKDADHYSNLYNNAPMPYALRLTNDGVFVHGSDVMYGEATHGCIGIPTAFAKKLFAQAKLGDIVIITDGKMMDLG